MTRISRSFFVGKYASAYIAEKGVSVRVFDTQIYKCCFTRSFQEGKGMRYDTKNDALVRFSSSSAKTLQNLCF